MPSSDYPISGRRGYMDGDKLVTTEYRVELETTAWGEDLTASAWGATIEEAAAGAEEQLRERVRQVEEARDPDKIEARARAFLEAEKARAAIIRGEQAKEPI